MKAWCFGFVGERADIRGVDALQVLSFMSCDFSSRIAKHFVSLTDPRRGNITYALINVVTIALCATIAGADDFVAIADWARQKRDWLGQFLDLSNGIPSHDRFNAIFRALKPEPFERCLVSWINALHEVTAGQLVAIDGKTRRRSFDKASAKSALHRVSAWATANKVSLGQVAVAEKSNEITKLLELLELEGALVTIDAMGCQTEIAKKILEKEADYVLAVKGNLPTLHSGIMEFFLDHMEDDFARVKLSHHETKEKGHGREEHRINYVCDVPQDLPDRARWKGLKRTGLAISDTVRGGKPCDDVRCDITSKKLSARNFGAAVRGHWGIEIPQPENPRGDNLCVVGRADYHRRGRLVSSGRVERPSSEGPWRHPMLDEDPIRVPPHPLLLSRPN